MAIEIVNSQEIIDKQKELVAIMSLTFKFSQGEPDSESVIINWLATNCFLDKFEIKQKIPRFVKEIRPPVKHKSESEVGSWFIQNNTKTMWQKLRRFSIQPQRFNAAAQVNDFTQWVIKSDIKYQEEPRPGRPDAEDPSQVAPDSSDDPHASHFRQFVINSHRTGHPAFDKLFIEVRDSKIIKGTKDFLPDMELSKLQTLWEKNHPGHSFVLTETHTE